MPRLSATAQLLAAFLLSACGGDGKVIPSEPGNGYPAPAGGVAQFTHLPVALDSFALITPLGNLNPPGHTTPTDHAYFYFVDFDKRSFASDTMVRTIYAPATGVLDFMMQPVGTDWKLQFRVTRDFWYYVDHIWPRPGLTLGTTVKAGEVLGYSGKGGAFDLGAVDYSVSHDGFVNPKRYADPMLHYVTPWKYFVEPLRSQLYAKQRRLPSAEPDARIDFGIAGRLVGDWFHESVPNSSLAMGPAGWPKTLAFVYDYYDPSKVRIVIGGTLDRVGIWTIQPSAPRPADVSEANGKVAYRLMYTESTQVQYGLMLVQLVAPDRIKVEVFPGSQAGDADFTTNAQTYLR